MPKWLAKNRQEQTEDPLFGTLVFVATRNRPDSFWEGRGRFSPTDTEVAYFVKAGNAGPTDSQRAVYCNIEKRYAEILPLVTPLLQRAAAEIAAHEPAVGQANFKLDIVHVPELESESMQWAMDFSWDQGDDWLFAVNMIGWQPTGDGFLKIGLRS